MSAKPIPAVRYVSRFTNGRTPLPSGLNQPMPYLSFIKMKKAIYLFLLLGTFLQAQETPTTLTFEEYIGYVKKYHPLVKQANLKLNEAEAYLMKARGAFDPKIEADFNNKQFENKEYYSVFNGSFKVPTWYGIELKAAFDNNEGIYLNPENIAPTNGLTSLGISVPIGQGLLINERMADLKKAKFLQNLNRAEQQLAVVNAIQQASSAYLEWVQTFAQVKLYYNYLTNAKVRYNGIVKLIEQGDKRALDSIEAGITVRKRNLNLEKATLKFQKAGLKLSNFLWLEDNVPVELAPNLEPELKPTAGILASLNMIDYENITIENNPKLEALYAKTDILKVDQKLRGNMLLPKLDLSYDYLSEPSTFDNYQFDNYKVGVNFALPIFLRKERANYKLAQIKVKNAELTNVFQETEINNKLNAQKIEIKAINSQVSIASELVDSYKKMLTAEERLFTIGESALFLINSRENSLVTSQLEQIELERSYQEALLALFNTRGTIE